MDHTLAIILVATFIIGVFGLVAFTDWLRTYWHARMSAVMNQFPCPCGASGPTTLYEVVRHDPHRRSRWFRCDACGRVWREVTVREDLAHHGTAA